MITIKEYKALDAERKELEQRLIDIKEIIDNTLKAYRKSAFDALLKNKHKYIGFDPNGIKGFDMTFTKEVFTFKKLNPILHTKQGNIRLNELTIHQLNRIIKHSLK